MQSRNHRDSETLRESLELTWLRGWHHLFVVDFNGFHGLSELGAIHHVSSRETWHLQFHVFGSTYRTGTVRKETIYVGARRVQLPSEMVAVDP